LVEYGRQVSAAIECHHRVPGERRYNSKTQKFTWTLTGASECPEVRAQPVKGNQPIRHAVYDQD
jgi:hypothetical protein